MLENKHICKISMTSSNSMLAANEWKLLAGIAKSQKSFFCADSVAMVTCPTQPPKEQCHNHKPYCKDVEISISSNILI